MMMTLFFLPCQHEGGLSQDSSKLYVEAPTHLFPYVSAIMHCSSSLGLKNRVMCVPSIGALSI